MKKIIVITVLVLMMIGLVYADAEPSSWALEEVEEAREKELIIPETDNNFRNNISREVFCKLIVNMVETTLGREISLTISNPFLDVNDTDVTKAYQLGIVNGTSATTFAPNNNITRQEIAAMMMRAARKLDDLRNTTYTQNIDINGIIFSDQSQIASWALNDVKELSKLGLMKGVGDNLINPLGNTTIEQSILLSLRLNKKVSSGSPENPNPDSNLAAIENKIFNVNENEMLTIAIDELVTGSNSLTQITSVTGLNGHSISADKRNIEYTAGEVTEDTSYDVVAVIGENDNSVTVNFKVIVKDLEGTSAFTAKENVEFTTNENKVLNISINDLVNGAGNFAEIVSVEGAEDIVINPNKKSFQYTVGHVSDDIEKNLSVTISENGVSVVASLKVNIKDITLGFIKNSEIRVPESSVKKIYIEDVFIEPNDDATIIAVESSTIPEERIEISPDKKFFTYKARQVLFTGPPYMVTLKVRNKGRNYMNKFGIIVENDPNNRLPQKKYSGEYYIVTMTADESRKSIPLTAIVSDANHDPIKGVKVYRTGRAEPSGIHCEFKPIAGRLSEKLVIKYNTPQPSGSQDSVQTFKLRLSDGKDNVTVKIKVIKQW